MNLPLPETRSETMNPTGFIFSLLYSYKFVFRINSYKVETLKSIGAPPEIIEAYIQQMKNGSSKTDGNTA